MAGTGRSLKLRLLRGVGRLPAAADLIWPALRQYHLAVVPAEAVGQAVHRHHFAEGAAGEASPGDIDEIDPAGLRLDLRLRSHPAQDLFGIGQEGEHRGGWRRDVRLSADDDGLLHRSLPWLRLPVRPRRRTRTRGSGLLAPE